MLDSFELLVRPLYSRIQSNFLEAEALGTLRDSLLPELISGELHVKDVEGLIERASA